jgi:hypothetical protein
VFSEVWSGDIPPAASVNGRAANTSTPLNLPFGGCPPTGSAIPSPRPITNRRHRGQGPDEHPHPEPGLPRADRHNPSAVATPGPGPPGAIPARNHEASCRADRPSGRVRLPDDLPGSLQEARRYQPASLPANVPGAHRRADRTTRSAKQVTKFTLTFLCPLSQLHKHLACWACFFGCRNLFAANYLPIWYIRSYGDFGNGR